MDIYLGINGVLVDGKGKLAPFANDFLQIILTTWPTSTYWLTTHQWRGEDTVVETLRPLINKDTHKLMHLIKPTEWHDLKTGAINFERPFLWFEETIFPDEKAVLYSLGLLDSWVKIDLANNPYQLLEIIDEIKSDLEQLS